MVSIKESPYEPGCYFVGDQQWKVPVPFSGPGPSSSPGITCFPSELCFRRGRLPSVNSAEILVAPADSPSLQAAEGPRPWQLLFRLPGRGCTVQRKGNAARICLTLSVHKARP